MLRVRLYFRKTQFGKHLENPLHSSAYSKLLGVWFPGKGPYPPNHEETSQDVSVTKCRYCGWYSRFDHLNFNWPARSTGPHDWCHRCGRVASELDLGKVQSKPFTPLQSDLYLGEKIIPFQLKAHDPREFCEFKQAWEKDQWIYDQAQMEEDLFLHRFGDRPTLQMILASIPVCKEIPKAGFVRPVPLAGERISAAETEALLLEEHNHKALLCLLYNFGQVAIPRDSKCTYGVPGATVRGEVRASFDKETRKGVSEVLLRQPFMCHHCRSKFLMVYYPAKYENSN